VFSKYAAVVKNLRGVLLLGPDEEEAGKSLAWLVKRFKYRNVGVPPALAGLKPFEEFEAGPFVELTYPVKSLARLVNLLRSGLKIRKEVAEAAVLASAYVSPILALGEGAPKLLEPLSVDLVDSRVKLTPRDLKLHLRIADYSVLDLYRWSVENAELLWSGRNQDLVKTRIEKIANDKKRYWRLRRGDREPFPFLLYIDPVQRIVKDRSLVKKLMRLPPHEASAGLAILTAVILRERNEAVEQG
jgi:hypothetical protein